MKRSDVIDNANIRAGDVIVGLSSYGQATYEKEYNSGIGSNGLTSARHDVFSNYLAQKYPESYDPGMPSSLVYVGKLKLTDESVIPGINVGKLLLSPTRTYSPIISLVFRELRNNIHGMVHCTGGGQTKILHFLDEGLRVVKNNLFPIPPLFSLIQQQSETDWEEMYKVFNMGHRMEIYLPEAYAQRIIEISRSFNVDAQIVGYVEKSEKKELIIESEFGKFMYS
jgi:phosphoribosylformylglycinamidine cyclo-ligase